MYDPSDDDIRSELAAQSRMIFGKAGLAGELGPTKEQFNRERPLGWPHSKTLLKMFGLTRNAEGWRYLLRAFGFLPPTNSEIQTSSQRRKEADPERPSVFIEDDYYPGLVASSVQESVQLTPLGDGWYQRTTRSVHQLR